MSTHEIPSGWYFCAESKELPPGGTLAKQLFGRKFVLWRTESAAPRMSDAVCPHLGSDLGKLGRVEGENLRCFSHGFTYDGAGDCVKTASGALPCRTQGVLEQYPLHEVGGVVLAWYDRDGAAPTWRIPESAFDDVDAVGDFVRSDFEFEVPAQILNEDNFDVGHLYQWHQVTAVESEPVRVAGPTISVAHRFKRHSILFANPLPKPFDVLTREIASRYSSTLHGHGLTDSIIEIFSLGLRMQDMIWVTPISATRIRYTTFLRRLRPAAKRSVVRRCADLLMQPIIFRFCVWRLRYEHRNEGHGFWENQTPVADPILTDAERQLIEPYREWCQQFEADRPSPLRAVRAA